jgi:hypothetical protein
LTLYALATSSTTSFSTNFVTTGYSNTGYLTSTTTSWLTV